jgi:NAD(P)-dependent dehydrogenase (short-subunit alcohol dehydrogenase family)
MDHIKDLKIVITAGASGIGSEVAIALSKAGAKVIYVT